MALITQQDIQRAAIAVAICLILLALRWLYFNTKLRAAYRYREEYLSILEKLSDDHQDLRKYDTLAEIEQAFVKLFKEARQYRPLLSYVSGERRPFGEMGPRQREVKNHLESFSNTIAYFLARRTETFELLFWADTLLNWPKSAVSILGFKREGSFAGFLKVAVLIVEIVAGIMLVFSRLQ